MKFHETSFDEYLQTSYKTNFHPELELLQENMPHIDNMGNLILYGPSGSGKYTQALRFIKKYSPSELKYDKRITLNNDKYKYIYRISDVHFEIDMALLGCNSKSLWHDIFNKPSSNIANKPTGPAPIIITSVFSIMAFK